MIQNGKSLSEIIGKKVNLKSKGNTGYVGLCPFHKEKTPSFFVNDDKFNNTKDNDKSNDKTLEAV